eukprot:1193509-Prorocentrum_minimum.AAC.7
MSGCVNKSSYWKTGGKRTAPGRRRRSQIFGLKNQILQCGGAAKQGLNSRVEPYCPGSSPRASVLRHQAATLAAALVPDTR